MNKSEEISGAIARGLRNPDNNNEVMGPVLAEAIQQAIHKEVMIVVNGLQPCSAIINDHIVKPL